MIDAPQITESHEQLAAVIHLQIARDDIQDAMAHAMRELISTIAAQGIAMAGPVFSHHFQILPTGWDLEVGVPVKTPVAAIGRVRPGKLPATRIARTNYHGPYEGLGAAWGQFRMQLSSQGHVAAKDLWEVYVVGPESNLGPEGWCTELNQPLLE